MHAPTTVFLRDQHLWLSPLRVIFWEEKRALILSDMHLGKSGHFRKSGIAIPQKVFKEDLHRLVDLLHQFQPTKLIVVGDMFHSHSNKELELFKKWRSDFSHIQIELVKGNHDILSQSWYEEMDIQVHNGQLLLDPFLFIHDLSFENDRQENEYLYRFSGHLHPGILLSGAGKQSIRLACFHFGTNHCTLPAFGAFTGLAMITPEKGDQVYAIAEKTLIRIA